MLKKIIAVISAALCLLSLASCGKNDSSEDTTSESFYYYTTEENTSIDESVEDKWVTKDLDDGTISVSYTGNANILFIPDEFEGITVSAVNMVADDVLTEIIIPDTVKVIESRAFTYCKNLKTVSMGNGVERIGACAFMSCSKLETIHFSENLEKIGDTAFAGCRSLKDVELTGTKLKEIGDNAFQRTLITELRLPEGFEIMGYAFPDMHGLTIYFPSTIKEIDAFEHGSDIRLCGPKGSVVQQYAKENGNMFVADEWIEDFKD